MTARALSFGPQADQYDAHRPSYPPEALTWGLGTAPLRIADLGAGTGILTRVLLALGHEVIPVEPDGRMRERLAAGTPGTTALAGSAEAIPLPDASVDAVVAGQAYHWFDTERAHPEIARVLRPGGVFAPVWNMRDESVPWVAALGHIGSGRFGVDSPPARRHADLLAERGDFGPLFEPAELREFHWTKTTTADELVALMATRSYHITATPAHRAEIDQAIRDLVAPLPQPIELPYVTEVFRSRKR